MQHQQPAFYAKPEAEWQGVTVVTNCRVHDNGYNVRVEGLINTFGPGNDVWANGYARCGEEAKQPDPFLQEYEGH